MDLIEMCFLISVIIYHKQGRPQQVQGPMQDLGAEPL